MYLCLHLMTSSRSCRFSDRRKLFTIEELRLFSAAARSAPSKKGIAALRGTCIHCTVSIQHFHYFLLRQTTVMLLMWKSCPPAMVSSGGV